MTYPLNSYGRSKDALSLSKAFFHIRIALDRLKIRYINFPNKGELNSFSITD